MNLTRHADESRPHNIYLSFFLFVLNSVEIWSCAFLFVPKRFMNVFRKSIFNGFSQVSRTELIF
jgi:hypothetical protein